MLKSTYSSLLLKPFRAVLTITINRPEANNSIDATLVTEIMEVIQAVEQDPNIKVLVIEGSEEYFCTGMDFNAVSKNASALLADTDPNAYYDMLQLFSTCSKIVICKIEGKVNAGGVGLVAACDIAIAGEKASFALSETLFGLLPACVMPFLIRRIGYQKAQWMTLVTKNIDAERAFQLGLVDEVHAKPQEALRRNLLRLTKLDTATIKDLKSYMNQLWILDQQTRTLAVNKITSLVSSDKVQHNIRNFVEKGKFPWDK